MELENNIAYKVYRDIDISNIANRLSEIDESVWQLDQSRQAYGAQGMGPYGKTNSIILNYCRAEPEADKEQALAVKQQFKDADIPKEYMKQVFPNIYYSREDFKRDVQKIEQRVVDEQLNAYTDSIVHELEKEFDGIAGLVLYERLPPKQKINMHMGRTYYLATVHRLHIPIKTNNQVEFNFKDDMIINMEQGKLYEVNNQIKHGFNNLGDTDRIHLIVDIIPRDKIPGQL